MKRASTIFYRLGQVFSIIFAIIYSLFLVGGVIMTVMGGMNKATPILIIGIVVTVVFLFLLVMDIILIVLAGKAVKSMKQGAGKLSSHIVLVIFGLLSMDYFYVIGGVLGFIVARQDKQHLETAPIETKAETVEETKVE